MRALIVSLAFVSVGLPAWSARAEGDEKAAAPPKEAQPAAPKPKADEKASPVADKAAVEAATKAVVETIKRSGPAIDVCTAKHVEEYPSAAGVVKLEAVVGAKGEVAKATATTSLEGARNLRACLERAASLWKFPAPSQPNAKLDVSVQVKKGVKFSVRAPGEKDPPPAAKPAEPEGFVRFLPGNWSEGGAGGGQAQQ